jgi:hypothetical protein
MQTFVRLGKANFDKKGKQVVLTATCICSIIIIIIIIIIIVFCRIVSHLYISIVHSK